MVRGGNAHGHQLREDGCHPHNGEYWYTCTACGESDWIASYGTYDQLFGGKPCPGPKETVPMHAVCPFCQPKKDFIVRDLGDGPISLWDAFPVVKGHALVISRRHVSSFLELTHRERDRMMDEATLLTDTIRAAYPDVTGFNLCLNVGAAAGQTVMHCHLHVIPRRDGDVEDPRGGLRCMFKNGNYKRDP